jgi:SNF2 family DNA or RNA helicase
MDKKVQDQIDKLMSQITLDDEFLKLKISNETTEKLYDYQLFHVRNIITSLRRNHVALDGSATGTGKTYVTMATCKELNLQPIIICLKSGISTWEHVSKLFDIKPLMILNYESVKSGLDPFLKIKDDEFIWSFEKRNIVVIFDEVHKCKNIKSGNGKLLLSLKTCKDRYKLIMLSATICDKMENFTPFGYMLGIYNKITSGKNWIDGIIREGQNRVDGKIINTLNKHLYPEYGSQMTLEEMGEKFPKNRISAECYTLDEKSTACVKEYYDNMNEISLKISNAKKQADKLRTLIALIDNIDYEDRTNEKKKEYDNMKRELEKLYDEYDIGKLAKLRQKIEHAKVGILIELFEKYYEQHKSLTIFVNYTETMKLLIDYFKQNKIDYSTVHGGQTILERNTNVENFQTNKVRVIVCMMQAGGVSISLHDLTGKYPRVSLISPSYSSIALTQALGRIYRTGVKSPCLQRIIFCANTCEENICNILRTKLEFLSKLTDEDLSIF